jgi:hypothetical protein
MMAGGGGLGKATGIDRVNTVRGGITIKMCPLFIERFLETGETTIGTIDGAGINGGLNNYLTMKCKETGKTGETINIGKGKEIGASRIRGTDPTRNGRLERGGNGTPGIN